MPEGLAPLTKVCDFHSFAQQIFTEQLLCTHAGLDATGSAGSKTDPTSAPGASVLLEETCSKTTEQMNTNLIFRWLRTKQGMGKSDREDAWKGLRTAFVRTGHGAESEGW